MKDKMRWARILPVFVLYLIYIILNSHFVLVTAFNYYENTLFTETKECSFALTLTEGYHILVIDNTGYVAGEYYRGRSTSSGQYQVILLENSSPLPDRSVFGEFDLKSQEYLWINISLTISYGDSALTGVSVTASNKISVFLTDSNGFTEFKEGVDKTTFKERPLPPIVIIFGIVLIGGGAIIITFIMIRRQKQRESIYLIGKKPSDQFVSSHKAIPPDSSPQIIRQGTIKTNNIISSSFCSKCGSKIVSVQQFCSNCGTKIES